MLHSSGDRERKKALSNVGSNNETHGDITKIGHFTKPKELTLISPSHPFPYLIWMWHILV